MRKKGTQPTDRTPALSLTDKKKKKKKKKKKTDRHRHCYLKAVSKVHARLRGRQRKREKLQSRGGGFAATEAANAVNESTDTRPKTTQANSWLPAAHSTCC